MSDKNHETSEGRPDKRPPSSPLDNNQLKMMGSDKVVFSFPYKNSDFAHREPLNIKQSENEKKLGVIEPVFAPEGDN